MDLDLDCSIYFFDSRILEQRIHCAFNRICKKNLNLDHALIINYQNTGQLECHAFLLEEWEGHKSAWDMRIQFHNGSLFKNTTPLAWCNRIQFQSNRRMREYNATMVHCWKIQLHWPDVTEYNCIAIQEWENTIPQWGLGAGNLFLSLPNSAPPSRT